MKVCLPEILSMQKDSISSNNLTAGIHKDDKDQMDVGQKHHSSQNYYEWRMSVDMIIAL